MIRRTILSLLAALLFAPEAAGAEEAAILRNADSGLFLSLTGDVMHDGGIAIQWRDVGQPDIAWVVEPAEGGIRIRNRSSGRYLTFVGDAALQWADTGQPGLAWDRENVGGAGCFRLKNRDFAGYLGVAGGSKRKGAALVRLAGAGPGTTWCLQRIEDPNAEPPASETVKLRNDYTGLYLVPAAAGVVQQPKPGAQDAWWTVERQADGTVTIRNAATGEFLAAGSGGTAPGGRVTRTSGADHPAAAWERHKGETAFCYKFRNRANGKYLAVDEGSMEAGAEVLLWPDLGHRLDIEWCREQ